MSDEIRIIDEYIIDVDIEDEWFAIHEIDNWHYDELGTVSFNTKDTLELIRALFIMYHKISGIEMMELRIVKTDESYAVEVLEIKQSA